MHFSHAAGRTGERGYSLLELMIVVTIIAVFASIAVPRFGLLITTSNENATRAKLDSMRKAIRMIYVDLEGHYPADLNDILLPGSKYMQGSMPVYTQAHGSTTDIDYVLAKDTTTDAGGWAYVTSGTDQGTVWVQCTHTDNRGSVWASY